MSAVKCVRAHQSRKRVFPPRLHPNSHPTKGKVIFVQEDMAASNYSLKVNVDLLDPHFDRYTLSLDAIPTYNVELDTGTRNLTIRSISKRASLAELH